MAEGAGSSMYPFDGTSANAAAEFFFDRPKTVSGSLVRRSAVELEIINLDANNDLQVSLDEQATWANVPSTKTKTFKGRIGNGRNSFHVKSKVGGAHAAFEGHSVLSS